jgi:tellurite resistance protein
MAAKTDPHAALIYMMIMMSAADREMHDFELGKIGGLVRHLPVFAGYDVDALPKTAAACAKLLARKDGPERALRFISAALPGTLHETAYIMACDVLAADGKTRLEEIRFLQALRARLAISELTAAALHRAARARYARA